MIWIFFSIFNPLQSILANMTKKKSILLNIFRGISIPAALFLVVSCRVYQYSTDITEGDLHSHLEYLSSDALDGRYPGTVGDAVAGKYLEEQFEAIGLQVRQQDFPFVQSIVRGPENHLEIKGQIIPPESFAPFLFQRIPCFQLRWFLQATDLPLKRILSNGTITRDLK